MCNHDSKYKQIKKIFFLFGFFICLGVFIFSVYKIFSIIQEYRTAEKYYSTIQEYSPFTSDDSAKTDEKDLKSGQLFIDVHSLKKINTDFVGWIYADDTKINYPVVQGTDNDFYVTHDFNKKILKNGSIFMDAHCNPNFKNKNTIIYGHNMKDGSMFGELDKYKSSSFYEKNKEILYIDKKSDAKKLKIYSAHIVKSTSYVYDCEFESDNSFEEFIEKTVSSSLYDTGVRPSVSDKIVTLSTCSYEYDEARLVIHAILVNY